MYYYNRPIGIYIFAAIFSLTLIVKIESTGDFVWMDILLAFLYGIMALGFGSLLWAAVGDIISPYLYNRSAQEQHIINRNLTTSDLPSEFQVPPDEYTRNLNKRINDGKLWAKGMSTLTEEEEAQLRRYFGQRWDARTNDTVIPSYVEESLMKVLQKRSIASGTSLTEYGETIIPNGNLVELEHT